MTINMNTGLLLFRELLLVIFFGNHEPQSYPRCFGLCPNQTIRMKMSRESLGFSEFTVDPSSFERFGAGRIINV